MNINYIKDKLNIDVVYEKEVTSTNDIVKDYFNKNNLLLIANYQSNGRGTKLRKFDSPTGGLYMSYMLKTTDDKLVFKTACAVHKALNTKGVFIKYINDIFYENKKLCGILVEKSGDNYIIGIGINLNKIDLNTAISLSEIKDYNINELILDIISNINSEYDYMSYYKNNCLTINKKILLDDIKYEVIDIDDNGLLVIKNKDIIATTNKYDSILYDEEGI